MGWKSIKEHYRISHLVQVTKSGICIGSPYIHDIIVVAPNGDIVKYDGTRNSELSRYHSEMVADPQKLRDLVATPDTFSVALQVYTYDGAEILEKMCEEYGWPNVTHDGQMMYDNTFSQDRLQVVEWAKRNCLAAIEMTRRVVIEKRADLVDLESMLARHLDDAKALGVEASA